MELEETVTIIESLCGRKTISNSSDYNFDKDIMEKNDPLTSFIF